MTELQRIPETFSKKERYETLMPMIQGLLQGETSIIANLANVAAALKQTFNWWWVGFYLVEQDQLVLGPFQGPVACTRINFGKGVCGTAWQVNEAILVPDVDQFPGHIACSETSKSELVIPIAVNNQVVGVLDIDSEHLNFFDETDLLYCQQIIHCIEPLFKTNIE